MTTIPSITPVTTPMHRDAVLTPADQDDFVVSREAYDDTITGSFTTELNATIAATNTLASEIEGIAGDTQTAKEDAQAAAQAAANSSTATKWVSAASYSEGEVTWSPIDFLSYRAKVNTSGITDPSLSSEWALQAYDIPFDEKVSHLSATANTIDASGNIASITYSTGNKEILTYVDNTLTKIEYTDTDSSTVKLTINYGLINGILMPTSRIDS